MDIGGPAVFPENPQPTLVTHIKIGDKHGWALHISEALAKLFPRSVRHHESALPERIFMMPDAFPVG